MSKPIDVFAFGVVLLELLTGRVRFHDGKQPPFLSHWVSECVGGCMGECMGGCDRGIRSVGVPLDGWV